MRGVKLMRRRDIDGLDAGVVAQLTELGICRRIEVARKGVTRFEVRLGGRYELYTGMSGSGAHHHGACHAEACDGEGDRLAGLRHQAGSPAASRSRSTQTSSP